MSWSVNYVGNPENITKKLQENSEKLSGKSKEEYDEALPHLIALIGMNYNKQYPNFAIKLIASGHAYSDVQGTNSYSNCQVEITSLGCELV